MADLVPTNKPPVVLDPTGAVIPAAAIARLRLGDEISGPSAIDGRPPFSGHLAFGMNPGQLAGIILSADQGSTLDYYTLLEEVEEVYPHYLAALSKRRRQVAQLPIVVEAADGGAEYAKHADFIRDWLKTDILARAMFDITDAIGKGFSVCELLWAQRPGYAAPEQIKWRTQRYFEIDWKDGETIWLRTGAGGENGYADLQPLKFLVHRHPSKSGSVVRSGLTRMILFLWLFHSYTLKDWAVFCQAYGFPIRVGRYGPEASDPDRRVLWRAVASIAGDVGAIIPKSMDLEFVKDNDRSAGSELYMKRADWLDRTVSKVVLGGTAGMDAIAGGHAVGKEHRAGEDDVEKFDAFLLGTSITQQLVQPMVALTFGPQDRYPVLRIGRQDRVPLNDLIAGVVALVPFGLRPKLEQIYEVLQLAPPDEGDETLMPPVPPAPPQDDPKIFEPPKPEMQTQRPRLLDRVHLCSELAPELMTQLTNRVAADASGALAGLTDEVRRVFDDATSMQDLAEKLSQLKLDPAAFAAAMQRGLALADLIGQAAMLDEMAGAGRRA